MPPIRLEDVESHLFLADPLYGVSQGERTGFSPRRSLGTVGAHTSRQMTGDRERVVRQMEDYQQEAGQTNRERVIAQMERARNEMMRHGGQPNQIIMNPLDAMALRQELRAPSSANVFQVNGSPIRVVTDPTAPRNRAYLLQGSDGLWDQQQSAWEVPPTPKPEPEDEAYRLKALDRRIKRSEPLCPTVWERLLCDDPFSPT